MKQILLIAVTFSCSVIGFSQKTGTQHADMQQRVVIATPPEEKINRLEAEIADLKAAHAEMKKQLSEIQATLSDKTKKKKLVVNRAGSKQVNWSSGEE